MTKDEAERALRLAAARTQQARRSCQVAAGLWPGALRPRLNRRCSWGGKTWPWTKGRRAIAPRRWKKMSSNGSRVVRYFAITAAWAGDEGARLAATGKLPDPAASLMFER